MEAPNTTTTSTTSNTGASIHLSPEEIKKFAAKETQKLSEEQRTTALKYLDLKKKREHWTADDVQIWFKSINNGNYAEYAIKFSGFNEQEMTILSEKQMKERCPEKGDVIYNEWHRTLIGIFLLTLC